MPTIETISRALPATCDTQLRAVRLLRAIFFASGTASLLYQVVWQRLLTVHYGVGSVSITLIVTIYMLGLGFGALIGGSLSERVRSATRAYAVVEAGIAAFGVISLPFLHNLGTWTQGSSFGWSLVYVTAFLGIPTLLMGMTLPLAVRVFTRMSLGFFSSVSTLYFLNTLGAAFGALFGAYVIVSLFGLDVAVYVAAGINALLAIAIFRADKLGGEPDAREPVTATHGALAARDATAKRTSLPIFPLVFIAGFLAIGYEIAWFRINEVLTKNSPYSFATVLGVYLAGIAFGSYGIQRFRDRIRAWDQRALFLILQAAIATYVLVAIGAYFYATKHTMLRTLTEISFDTHPQPPIIPGIAESTGSTMRDLFASTCVLFWPLVFVFIPTLLMGATFPLLTAAAYRGIAAGRTVGVIYCVNILGNVAGGIVTGFVLLPLLGTERTLAAFAIVGLGLGALAKTARIATPVRVGLATAGILFVCFVFPGRGELYRVMHASEKGPEDKIYLREGVDAVVLTFESKDRVRNFINGLSHGFWPMREAHFDIREAVASAPRLEEAVVIGFGSGNYVEALLRVPSLRRLTLIELSQTLMGNLHDVDAMERIVSDPRVNLVIDDGRRFLQRTTETFDLIATDPLHIRSGYSNNVYSLEFLTLVRSRLRPGGIALTYNGNDGGVANTVLCAFPYARIYRTFCLGSDEPLAPNRDRARGLLRGLSPERRTDIRQERAYLGDQATMRRALGHLPINSDACPVAEYFLGMIVRPETKLDAVLEPPRSKDDPSN